VRCSPKRTNFGGIFCGPLGRANPEEWLRPDECRSFAVDLMPSSTRAQSMKRFRPWHRAVTKRVRVRGYLPEDFSPGTLTPPLDTLTTGVRVPIIGVGVGRVAGNARGHSLGAVTSARHAAGGQKTRVLSLADRFCGELRSKARTPRMVATQPRRARIYRKHARLLGDAVSAKRPYAPGLQNSGDKVGPLLVTKEMWHELPGCFVARRFAAEACGNCE